MYNKVQEEIFDGMLRAALKEYVIQEGNALPPKEELDKKYPSSKKELKKYLRIAKARKYNISLPLLYLRRAAVVFLVLVSVTFGVFVTNGKVRASIRDAVVEWFDKYASVSFSESADKSNTSETDAESTSEAEEIPDLKDLKIGYIPEGFELSNNLEKENKREYTYLSKNGACIMVGIYSSNGRGSGFDIEYSKYEEMQINGNEAYVSYDETEQIGSLVCGNNKYTIYISGDGNKSDLIKIAENIK